MLLRDFASHPKPKPSAKVLLDGEEGLKEPRQVLGSNSVAVVSNGDDGL
jgi:hypothetical protein